MRARRRRINRVSAGPFVLGGVFFTTGAYAGLLLIANSADGEDPDGILRTPPWRWRSASPTGAP